MYRIVRANKAGDVGNAMAGSTVESVLAKLELAVEAAEWEGWTVSGGIQYVIRSGIGNHHFAMQAMVKPDACPRLQADASGKPKNIESPPEGTAAASHAWKTETPDIAKSLIAGTSAAFPQLSEKPNKKRNDKLAAAVQSVVETQTQED